MTTLIITIDSSKADQSLFGFPLVGEQYIDGSLATFGTGTETAEIDLQGHELTAAQELFLDSSDAVIRYQVQ